MAVSVKADLVTPRQDFFWQLREDLHPIAAEEKGGLGTPRLQALKQPLREPAGGPVVKGQGQIFFLGGPDGSSQGPHKGQDQQETDPFSSEFSHKYPS